MIESALENKPGVLQAIGNFVVYFNVIDEIINTQFYFIIDQQDESKRPILDFLCSCDFSKKVKLLEKILGEELSTELFKINEFRVVLSHGMYGVGINNGAISNAKREKSGKFTTTDIDLLKINQFIEREKAVWEKLHRLVVVKMNKSDLPKG